MLFKSDVRRAERTGCGKKKHLIGYTFWKNNNPAFTSWQVGEAPAKPRDPEHGKERASKKDGRVDIFKHWLNISQRGVSCIWIRR